MLTFLIKTHQAYLQSSRRQLFVSEDHSHLFYRMLKFMNKEGSLSSKCFCLRRSLLWYILVFFRNYIVCNGVRESENFS